MIQVFRTLENEIHQINEVQEGCWVALTAPSPTEIKEISDKYRIEVDHLQAPLDEEERSRIEVEDHYTLIIVDIPMTEERKGKEYFVTIPCGIIIAEDLIFTVCLIETPILQGFMDGRIRNFFTFKKTRFILQILYRNASQYLQYLRYIDKKSEEVEQKLHASAKNEELIEFLELEKSLVYFTNSLRSNEIVLEKMLKIDQIKKYPEDEDLLEDVIIENKQAIEMANIYSGILNSTMDAYANIISNNMNISMKFLAVLTIVMSIPTMIASFAGMNVPGIPFANTANGFWFMVIVGIGLAVIIGLIMHKKKMF
jgi:magnesium transporter